METNVFSKGISVVIPFYKGKKHIKETLRSLIEGLEVTDLEYEIIIVNDSVEESILNLSDLNSNIKIINNKRNKGVAYSRNIGRKNSIYEYIYFIDQDDFIEHNFFKAALKYINVGYDFILYNYNVYDDNNSTYRKKYNFIFDFYVRRISSETLIKMGNIFISPGQVLIRNSDNIKFIETKTPGADDFYMFVDLFWGKNNKKIAYVKTPLFNYRVHENNFTKQADFTQSSLECFEQYKKNNPDILNLEKILLKRYNKKNLNILSRIIYKINTF